MENRCVMCGEIVPEGRYVCPDCEKGNDYSLDETIKHLEAKTGRPLTEKEMRAVQGMSTIMSSLWSDK